MINHENIEINFACSEENRPTELVKFELQTQLKYAGNDIRRASGALRSDLDVIERALANNGTPSSNTITTRAGDLAAGLAKYAALVSVATKGQLV